MPSLYCPGDNVLCKLKDDNLVYASATSFDETHPFDIICLKENGYLILVPQDFCLLSSYEIKARDCRQLDLEDKFADSQVAYITDYHVVSLRFKMTGMTCHRCNEHNEYGEVNRISEATGKGIFLCFLCRTYIYR